MLYSAARGSGSRERVHAARIRATNRNLQRAWHACSAAMSKETLGDIVNGAQSESSYIITLRDGDERKEGEDGW